MQKWIVCLALFSCGFGSCGERPEWEAAQQARDDRADRSDNVPCTNNNCGDYYAKRRSAKR